MCMTHQRQLSVCENRERHLRGKLRGWRRGECQAIKRVYKIIREEANYTDMKLTHFLISVLLAAFTATAADKVIKYIALVFFN